MLGVDDFKSLVTAKGGIARSNLFVVELPGIAPYATMRDLNLLCKDVTLPGRQITTRERFIGLTTRKMAYGYLVDDISMTFHVLNDYGVKEYFEAWQNVAVDQNTYEIGYKADYAQSIKISQIKKGTPSGIVATNKLTADEIIYSCVLEEAFPTTLNAIQLNNELDGILELNVQISYTNWRSAVTSEQSLNSISTLNGAQILLTST